MFTHKQWLLSHLVITALVLLTLLQYFSVFQKLELTFLDIGQGDSILIETSDYKNILIDAGIDDTVVRRLGEELGHFDKTIDLLIITHPDRDHYAGAMELFGKYKIKEVLLTGLANKDQLYQEFIKTIKAYDIPMRFAQADEDIVIGQETVLDILYPFEDMSLLGKETKDKNNTSISLRLVHQGKAVAMLTGDAELEQEWALVTSGQDLKSDILKLGHHGSNSSTHDFFLSAVQPTIGIVSAGKDNKFGHPHEEVLTRVSDLNIRNTINEGSVHFVIE